MKIHNLPGSSAYDSDSDTEEILKRHDAYIVALARKKVPRNIVGPKTLHDEIDELAQAIRIKLWLMLRKKHITNPSAYIRCIGQSQSVDMVRRHKPMVPLPIGEDGELYQGSLMAILGEGMQDPLWELEQEEAVAESITEIADGILTLPPCQQRAMLCSLKDRLDDTLPLIQVLMERGIDMETANRPETKNELQSQCSSLAVARKKLRVLRSEHDL